MDEQKQVVIQLFSFESYLHKVNLQHAMIHVSSPCDECQVEKIWW